MSKCFYIKLCGSPVKYQCTSIIVDRSQPASSWCFRFNSLHHCTTMPIAVLATSTLLSMRCILATVALIMEFIVCRFFHSVPLFHVVVEKAISKKANMKMNREDYWDSLFGWQMFKECWKMKIMDLRKQVCEGQDAVNSPLISADSRKSVRLLDLVKLGRPLVLNFGSSSWPPFMAKLAKFNEIVRDFSDVADFAIIYISEAHAQDGWSFKVRCDIQLVLIVCCLTKMDRRNFTKTWQIKY